MHQSGFKNQEKKYQDIVPSSVPLDSSRAESLVGELHAMPMYPITTETDIDITAVLLPSGGIQSHHHAMRTAVSETQPPAFTLLPSMSNQDNPRLLLKMQPAIKDTNASSTLPFSFGTQLGSIVMEGNVIEFLEDKQTKKPGVILSENGTEKHTKFLGRSEHTICETSEFEFCYSDLHIKAEKKDIISLLQNRTDMTCLQRKCRTIMTPEDPKITECSDLYCSDHDIKECKLQTCENSQEEETVSDKEKQTDTITEPFVKKKECVFLKEQQQLSCKVTTSFSDTKTNRLKPQEQSMQIKSLLNSMHDITHQENHNITKYLLETTHIELNEKPPKDDEDVIHECAISEENEVEELHSSKNISDHCEEAGVKEDEFIQRNDALNKSAICKKTQDKDNIYGKDHCGMNEHIQFEETNLGQVENVHTKNNTLKKSDQLDEMEVGEGSVKDQPIPWLKNIRQKGTHSTYIESPVELDQDSKDDMNIQNNDNFTVNIKLHGETQVKEKLNRQYIWGINKSIQFVKNQGAEMQNVQRKDHYEISTNDIYNTALVGEDEYISRKEHAVNEDKVEDENKGKVEAKNSHRTNRHANKSDILKETHGRKDQNKHTKDNTVDKSDQLEEMEVREDSVKDQPIPWLKDTGQKGTQSTFNESPVEHKNIHRKEQSLNKGDVESENKGQVEAEHAHRTNHNAIKKEVFEEDQVGEDETRHSNSNTIDKSDQLEEMQERENLVEDQIIPWLKDTGQKGTHSTLNESPVELVPDVEDKNIHSQEQSVNEGDVEDDNKGQVEAEDAYRINHNAIKNDVFEEDQVGEDEKRHTNNHTTDKIDQLEEIEDREDSVKDQPILWLKDTAQMDTHIALNESPVELVPDVEDKNIHRKEHSVNKHDLEDENKDQVEAEDANSTNSTIKNEVFGEAQVVEDENRHTKNKTVSKSDQLEEMEDREDSVKDQLIPWLKDTGQKGTHTSVNENPAELDSELENDNIDRNYIYTINTSVICEQTHIKENVYRQEPCKMTKSVQFEEIQMGQVQRAYHYDISKTDKAQDEEANNIHMKEHSGNKSDPEDEKNGQDAADSLHRTNHHAIKSEMLTETQGGEEGNICTKDEAVDKSDPLEEMAVGEDSVKDQSIHWLEDTGQNDTYGTFTEYSAEFDPDTEDDNMKLLEEYTANFGNKSNACQAGLDESPEVACPTSTLLLVIDCDLSSQLTVQSEDRPASKQDNKDEDKATPQVFMKAPTQDTYGKIIREKGLSLLEDLRKKYLDSEGHGFTLLDSGMVLTGDGSQREKNIAFVTLRNGLKLGMAIPISDLFLYYNLGLHFYITEQLNDDWYGVKDRITQEKMLMKKVPVISSWGKSLHNFLFLPYHPRLLVPYAVLYDRNGSIHYLMEYKHVLAIGRPPPGRHFDKEKSFWEVMHFLSYCKKNGLLPLHVQETILHTEQGVCFDPSGLCNSEDPCILKKSIKSVLLLLFCSEQQEHLDQELEPLLDRAYQCLEEDTGWPEQLISETGLSLQRVGPIPFSFPCFSEEN